MSFAATISNEFKTMLNTSRINRLRYFSYFGVIYAIVALVGILIALIAAIANWDVDKILSHVSLIAIPLFCFHQWLLVKRINDSGTSSKLYFKLLLVMICCALFSMVIEFLSRIYAVPALKVVSVFTLIPFGVSCLTVMIYVLVYTFSKGNEGENQYGQPPAANNYFTYTFFTICLLTFAIQGYFEVVTRPNAELHSPAQQNQS